GDEPVAEPDFIVRRTANVIFHLAQLKDLILLFTPGYSQHGLGRGWTGDQHGLLDHLHWRHLLVIEIQLVLADADDVFIDDFRTGYLNTVDERAVGAIEVFDNVGAVFFGNFRVPARDRKVLDR